MNGQTDQRSVGLDLHFRPATETDSALIKAWVKRERLDPTQLRWQNFLMAEHEGQVIGFGQLRDHGAIQELGSLIVQPEYRERGVGGAVIRALIARARKPLYLDCELKREGYYARFGFKRIGFREMPRAILKKQIMLLALRLLGYPMIAMRYENSTDSANAETEPPQ